MFKKLFLCLAPEYAEAPIKLDETLGTVSANMKAAPFCEIQYKQSGPEIDTVMPFGKLVW